MSLPNGPAWPSDAWGRPYVPAVGPRLKFLLALIFAAFAVLGASGAYLAAIRWLDNLTGRTYTTPFKYWMLIAHVGIGLIALLPFLAFGLIHWRSARNRPNQYAVKLGLLLFFTGVLVCVTGLGLVRLDGLPQLRTDTTAHTVVLWLHILLPVLAVAFYVMHRRAGPDIQWKWGYAWGAGVGLFCAVMLYLHGQDPRQWHKEGSVEGKVYFRPSDALTSDGNFIAPEALMMDEYCLKCHADIYKDHIHSAHHFSSFSNPAYLFSVQETRQSGRERDGNVKGSRWCAGCHDPVPFFGGVFEDPRTDPKYNADSPKDQLRLERYQEVEDVLASRKHPADSKVSSAGVTCVTCHAITNINAPTGNAAYTIEEPQHYPFAYSKNSLLQWINNQVVKAEPSFHKKTFLKPFHKTAEFCSTCHKVSLPVELNHYKEFLRGQNHYDSYLLSGASGVGVRSFYYPPKAQANCAGCHMPAKDSKDFGARDFAGTGGLQVHNHRFVGANTGLFDLLARDPRYAEMREELEKSQKAHADFLRGTDPEGKDRKLRIDLFGVKEGGTIDGKLTVLRPELPKLQPGKSYLVEVVVRTVNLGHPFSQGTADSNEIWVDFEATAGGKVIARSGALADPKEESGEVDPWSHFINVLMLTRKGERINRRNPQDIFTPLYDKQIPPGAASVVHYRLDVPADATGPVELAARVRYRKFDYEYMKLVHKDKPVPKLPIVDLCADRVTLPVAGRAETVAAQTSPIKPPWQRWNDYGIGCYIEGGAAPTGLSQKRGEMKQALAAFRHLTDAGEKDALPHGYLNSARVLIDESRLDEAAAMLNLAGKAGAPWWTVAWFKAIVSSQNATKKEQLDAAIGHLETILDPANQPRERGFDFRRDYVVLTRLGNTLFKRSQLELDDPAAEEKYLRRAVEAYEKVLDIDPEEVEAHYGLYQCYDRLARELPDEMRASGAVANSPETLQSLGAGLGEPGGRREAALALARDLPAFLDENKTPLYDAARSPKLVQKLPTVKALIPKAREAFHAEQDATTRQAVAQLLALLHNASNAAYKLDDQARARATTTYRSAHPAANHAAEAIVIYPTTPSQVGTLNGRPTEGGGR